MPPLWNTFGHKDWSALSFLGDKNKDLDARNVACQKKLIRPWQRFYFLESVQLNFVSPFLSWESLGLGAVGGWERSECPVWEEWFWEVFGDRILRRCNKTWSPFIAVEFLGVRPPVSCKISRFHFTGSFTVEVGVGYRVCQAAGVSSEWINNLLPESWNSWEFPALIHSMLWFPSLPQSRNLSPAGSTEDMIVGCCRGEGWERLWSFLK